MISNFSRAGLVATAALMISSVAWAKNPMVGGAEMLETKNIVQNAMNSADHSTLVSALKSAELVDTLSGPGPYTVFAPTNTAFSKLPSGTMDMLLKPESKETLRNILTYHVIAGKMTAADLARAIKEGNGKAELKTVQGTNLTASMVGKSVVLTDAKGIQSRVTISNVAQSNGVLHVIDTVLMP